MTAVPSNPPHSDAPAGDRAARAKAANRRVAWILVSVAATFFIGIIATRWLTDAPAGIGVMGVLVLLFLGVAIGRNLRGRH